MFQVDLLSDASEIIRYPVPGLPIYARAGRLSNFPNMAALCHWHTDFEFIVMESGEMSYYIGGETVRLTEGMGVFVNSGQLHYGYAADGKTDGSFLCILLHPRLLSAEPYVTEMYLTPLLQSAPLLLLHESVTWEREVMARLRRVYALGQDGADARALEIVIEFHELLRLISARCPAGAGTGGTDEAMRRMIGYIQQHYAEKISLDAIASAGMVCRSRCCTLFSETLHRSPGQYLTEYRLDKSLERLMAGESVTEAALGCGFSTASYFIQTFRGRYGSTPAAYRRRSRAGVFED